MPNPITLQSSLGLSDILGAYDVGHWETVTAQLKPSTGTLLRGSVLSSVVADAGKLTLTVGGSEATAYGILLDKSVRHHCSIFRWLCHGFRSSCGVVPRGSSHRRGWNRRGRPCQAAPANRNLHGRGDRSGGTGRQGF
jgi:hypothetical protein